MRIKRLEIQGFKSFKDKTVVHFDEGITGIVGPNGCGKSNIVDAFFWVMGEQSYKHMRGSKSQDLIFNGSSKYSPLGYAEATLVMEQDVVDTSKAPSGASVEDHQVEFQTKETAITRRVYRSGEGEYFINGVQARLKDIHELFLDTGVGAKGYSVIEQGQIGKIVNSKPEDRRRLVEDAAGIAKYKARKKESLRKMEATRANLSRLNDVIQEVERSLSSLERQASKARKYKEYKKELFEKEITWGRRKARILQQSLESLSSEKDALEQELAGLRAERQVLETDLETDQVKQTADAKISEELQTQIQNDSSELATEKSALELSRRRQEDLAQQVATLEAEKNEVRESVEADQENLESFQRETEEAQSVLDQMLERARDLELKVEEARQKADEAVALLESRKNDLLAEVAEASNLNSMASEQKGKIDSFRDQVQRIEGQMEDRRVELRRVHSDYNDFKEKLEGRLVEKAAIETKIESEKALVAELEPQFEVSKQEQEALSVELTQIRSKLESLEELEAAYEGFGEGPKAALDWAKSAGRDSTLRALADGFIVEAGFEKSLDGWLENRLESLVCDDARFALEALENVRAEKQGRAAIFIAEGQSNAQAVAFDSIQSTLTGLGFDVKGELENFVRLSDEMNQQTRTIASQAIGRVVVVDSMNALGSLMENGGVAKLQGWSLVSLEGDALDQQGVLRGGSNEADQSASLLARKRVIAELRDAVAEREQALEAAEAKLNDLRTKVESARENYELLKVEFQAAEVDCTSLEKDVDATKKTQDNLSIDFERVKRERESLAEGTDLAEKSLQEIQTQLDEIVSRRSELEEVISQKNLHLEEAQNHVKEQESALQTIRVDEASLRERAQSKKRELEGLEGLIASRSKRIGEIERTLDRVTEEQSQFTGGDPVREQKIEELTRRLAEGQEQLSEVRDRLEQFTSRLNQAMDRIKEVQGLVDGKANRSNQIAVEFEKYTGELGHLVQNLEEKYGANCLEDTQTAPQQEEMEDPVVTTEMTEEEEKELFEDVERLKERIRRLGEVNVMAVEEYEEIKGRFDYLMTERGDLETSIKNLEEAIEHINRTSEDRFSKAFEAIATRFEKLFPVIFGGGSAKLSLVFPEGTTDILEAGIDILAQPPGKKVSNIGLLSGGEKALTAVSLIFAIFMVKPSPFCILDEVDAPLDDANIGKFNMLLKEMAVKSQFIVITHNKKTMEMNDKLYGVTMEEPGVSKMVSIELQ